MGGQLMSQRPPARSSQLTTRPIDQWTRRLPPASCSSLFPLCSLRFSLRFPGLTTRPLDQLTRRLPAAPALRAMRHALCALRPAPQLTRLLSAVLLPLLFLLGCASNGPSKHGPRQSPGSELVQRMSFPPLQVTVPRVGREVERRILDNGIILYLAEDRSLPVLDVHAVFRAGTLYEPDSRPGVAQLTASQLRNGGTQRLAFDALNEELEVFGASIEASVSGEAISLSLSALAKDTDRVLQIFADVIRLPAFHPDPLQTAKGRITEDLRRLADSPPRLLAREFNRTMYTEAYPLGRPLTPAQVEAIRGEDPFRTGGLHRAPRTHPGEPGPGPLRHQADQPRSVRHRDHGSHPGGQWIHQPDHGAGPDRGGSGLLRGDELP